jgi:hypothetical protein
MERRRLFEVLVREQIGLSPMAIVLKALIDHLNVLMVFLDFPGSLG